MENDALVLGGRARGDSRNKALSKKQIRIISVEKYNITQLNNEYCIKQNTRNYSRHCTLPHKNISRLTVDRVNKLEPQVVTSIPYHISYQKNRRK